MAKEAHLIHRLAYLSATHSYSRWKCVEKHSWMYGCGRLWYRTTLFPDNYSAYTSVVLRVLLVFTGGGSTLRTHQLIGHMLSRKSNFLFPSISFLCCARLIGSFSCILVFQDWSRKCSVVGCKGLHSDVRHKAQREEQVCSPSTSVP